MEERGYACEELGRSGQMHVQFVKPELCSFVLYRLQGIAILLHVVTAMLDGREASTTQI